VRIGMTLAAAAAVLGAPFEPSTEQGECIYRRHPVVPAGVLFMQIGDRIARIDVRSFSVRTDRGVGPGDSEAFVRDAYGTALVSSPHKYTNDGRYLILAPDPAHRLVFETEGGWVTRYRLGRVPEVEWVEGCS
jgi:hypothetical protein